jgi:pimeloyl-ACP methyl ester carboxylesterase
VHGGLWEDAMTAHRFWTAPGVTAGLQQAGFIVLAPNRLQRAPSWEAEAEHLAAGLPERPVTVIAASNGCSAALRLALASPARVTRLLLAWPATAGGATALPACPEPLRPGFPAHLARFLASATGFSSGR